MTDFKPKEFKSETILQKTPCGNLYVTVVFAEDGGIRQILIPTTGNRDNDCGHAFVESIADLATYALRRTDQKDARLIIKALSKHYCNRKVAGVKVNSCADAISKVLERVMKCGT